MQIKSRVKPDQLKILESLKARHKLEYSKQLYLMNLQKGLEGEERFDELIRRHLDPETILLKDRRVNVNGSTAQIDALLVTGDTLRLYEIKNYEGDYQQLPGHLRTLKGQEFICPSVQLNRTRKVLEQVLGQWTNSLEIKAYVIFVNPGFTLYDAKVSNPFILPTQIAEHFKMLKSNEVKASKKMKRLIDKLLLETNSGVNYRDPSLKYTYKELKKGLICNKCCSFNLSLSQRQAKCLDCGKKNSITQLLTDHIDEITLLFPEMKVSTPLMYDWIDGKLNKRRVGKILKTLS
ncbi:nuclease-related domain-containing protein [Alkalibacterium kapii]|uniref:NERD domain-containing protein n=1 Tax=Alkalibacterium kapii TaxID=426704 RepID=A0A511AT11_9LACT|nr:nuclease-related domain-containing protein [Alkalibacterium kapii]GEK91340.1 hypothetical protein AKA01nite_09620 [Alkalibacterium kapii]